MVLGLQRKCPWILGFGFWILGFRFWILHFGLWEAAHRQKDGRPIGFGVEDFGRPQTVSEVFSGGPDRL